MGIKAETHRGSGDSSAMLAPEGVHRAVLAEVVDMGREPNKWGKRFQKVLAIFELPESLCKEGAIEGREGTPMQVLWWINNLAFGDPGKPEYRTYWEQLIASWFGKSVPPELHAQFMFGREYGDGPEDWVEGLEGPALKKQKTEKPGIPIGFQAMLRVVHRVGKDGNTYAEPAPALPPKGAEPDEVEGWIPGLKFPDEKARTYTVSDSYVPWNERKGFSQADGGGGQSAAAPEPEDDEIPF